MLRKNLIILTILILASIGLLPNVTAYNNYQWLNGPGVVDHYVNGGNCSWYAPINTYGSKINCIGGGSGLESAGTIQFTTTDGKLTFTLGVPNQGYIEFVSTTGAGWCVWEGNCDSGSAILNVWLDGGLACYNNFNAYGYYYLQSYSCNINASVGPTHSLYWTISYSLIGTGSDHQLYWHSVYRSLVWNGQFYCRC